MIKLLGLIALLATAPLLASASSDNYQELLGSLLRITSTNLRYRYNEPWNAPRIKAPVVHSGLVVEVGGEKLILTAAHAVSNPAYIRVEKAIPSSFSSVPARVVYRDDDCDLALLRVDPAFFADIKVLAWNRGMPQPLTDIHVAGYPFGKPVVTSGKITGLSMETYKHRGNRNLAATISAASNPGDSGGPVVTMGPDGRYRLLGLVFQKVTGAEGLWYMIPGPVVSHFLADAKRQENGENVGFPYLGLTVREATNLEERRFLGMGGNEGGLVVVDVPKMSDAFGPLQRNDVIVNVSDATSSHKILAGGKIFVEGSLVSYEALISGMTIGSHLTLRLIRQGQEHTVTFPLTHRYADLRLDGDNCDEPSFFIYGGLVFQPLTRQYILSWGPEWRTEAPEDIARLYESIAHKTKDHRDHQVILLNRVLHFDDLNYGIDYEDRMVVQVNGHPIHSMRGLVWGFQSLRRENHEIDLQVEGTTQRIYLNRTLAEDSIDKILRDYQQMNRPTLRICQ